MILMKTTRKYIKLWPKVKGLIDRKYYYIAKSLLFFLELKDGSTEEMDLFRLVVVNEYGSQEIKKLVDDPRRPLSLTG